MTLLIKTNRRIDRRAFRRHEGSNAMDWFEQILGGLLLLLILLDVFLTVLYARASSGIFSPRVARSVGLGTAGAERRHAGAEALRELAGAAEFADRL